MKIKEMNNEVLVARLIIVANKVSCIGESNEIGELQEEVLFRMSNGNIQQQVQADSSTNSLT